MLMIYAILWLIFNPCLTLQGLGTDEETLIEIVCSRSKDELMEIKTVYKECEWETPHLQTSDSSQQVTGQGDRNSERWRD